MRKLCTLTLAALLLLSLAACGAPGPAAYADASAPAASEQSSGGETGESKTPQKSKKKKKSKKKSQSKQADNTPAAPLSQAVSLVETAVKKNFGKHYSMDYDKKSVTVQIWPKGVGEQAYNASLGDGKSLKKWKKRVALLEKRTPHWVKNLKEAGYGGMSVSVSVQNDLNRENTLLTVTDGKAVYNWVEEARSAAAQTAVADAAPAASTP